MFTFFKTLSGRERVLPMIVNHCICYWIGSILNGSGFRSRPKCLEGKLPVRNLNGPLDLKIISPTVRDTKWAIKKSISALNLLPKWKFRKGIKGVYCNYVKVRVAFPLKGIRKGYFKFVSKMISGGIRAWKMGSWSNFPWLKKLYNMLNIGQLPHLQK